MNVKAGNIVKVIGKDYRDKSFEIRGLVHDINDDGDMKLIVPVPYRGYHEDNLVKIWGKNIKEIKRTRFPKEVSSKLREYKQVLGERESLKIEVRKLDVKIRKKYSKLKDIKAELFTASANASRDSDTWIKRIRNDIQLDTKLGYAFWAIELKKDKLKCRLTFENEARPFAKEREDRAIRGHKITEKHENRYTPTNFSWAKRELEGFKDAVVHKRATSSDMGEKGYAYFREHIIFTIMLDYDDYQNWLEEVKNKMQALLGRHEKNRTKWC